MTQLPLVDHVSNPDPGQAAGSMFATNLLSPCRHIPRVAGSTHCFAPDMPYAISLAVEPEYD